ncbi:MAG TPA: hypothetical protein PKA41_06320 [Verrucomicrobiota bacterium]|nr:hypothetical protein [Verrucomicrobiota bacterium]
MKHILTIVVALAFAVPALAHEGCPSSGKSKDSASESCPGKKSEEGKSCSKAEKEGCAKDSDKTTEGN